MVKVIKCDRLWLVQDLFLIMIIYLLIRVYSLSRRCLLKWANTFSRSCRKDINWQWRRLRSGVWLFFFWLRLLLLFLFWLLLNWFFLWLRRWMVANVLLCKSKVMLRLLWYYMIRVLYVSMFTLLDNRMTIVIFVGD